ncbi:dihydrolipoyl dehydrogenase [Mycoplasmatota bacterium]|nr:dihydrolipoyl dehydrogenase [Mycoplasmatota bacterium]
MEKLVIIGAGPGGYEVAIEAAQKGLEVVLIDKDELGGTCLNYGCIPTKTLYKSSEIIKSIKGGNQFGIDAEYKIDFEKVISNKDKIVADLKNGIDFLIKKNKIEFIKGEATFVDERSIKVNDQVIEGDYFIIATGSAVRMLDIEGVDSEAVVTSKEMLSLNQIPKTLTVIGGGVIGVELASIYNYFGSEVTILEYQKNLLGYFEEDISKRFKPVLTKQGINVVTGANVTKIDNNTVTYNIKGQENSIDAELILMSVGRIAYMDNLNIEKIGIEFDKTGIKVNDNFQTSIPNIYAVGDVLGGSMLAHTATFQSYKALSHILNEENTTDFNMIPACVFTFPELASIGLTRKEAKEKFDSIEVRKGQYSANGKANAMGENTGFIQIILNDGYIVGASIMGYSASTIIHEIALIINSGKRIDEFRDMIFAHPTLSEVLSSAIRE